MSSIRSTIGGTMGKLIGIAIALAVVSLVSALGILASGTSAALVSAITQINTFLPIVGLAIAVGIVIAAFGSGVGGRD